MSKIEVIYEGKKIEVERVGSYGTYSDPEVRLSDGTVRVAELCFIDEHNQRLTSMCQSVGCHKCTGDYLGCRYGEYKDKEVAYVL